MRLAMTIDGRTRAAAIESGTWWQASSVCEGGFNRVRVYVDLVNPVTLTNTRAIMQTDRFIDGVWVAKQIVSPITIGAAWHWCQDNADAIMVQKPIGGKWVHWDCLITRIFAATPSLAQKIGCG
jgi:hypothetical protein